VQDVLPGVAIEPTKQTTVLREDEGDPDTMTLPDPPLAGIDEAAAVVAVTFVRLIGIVPDAVPES
jgi:hypothetical protein